MKKYSLKMVAFAHNLFIQKYFPRISRFLQGNSARIEEEYDEKKAFSIHLKPLISVWLFPSEDDMIKPNLFYLKFSLVLTLSSVFMIGSFLHFITTLVNHTNVDVIEDIIFFISLTTLTLVIIYFTYTREALMNLIAEIHTFNYFGLLPGFRQCNDMHALIGWLLFHIYCPGSVFMYLWFNYFYVGSACEEKNRIENLKEPCGLYAPGWIPGIDLRNIISKHIYIIFQLITSFVVQRSGLIVLYLEVIFVDIICLKIKHLNKILVDTINTKTLSASDKELLIDKCIEYHYHILRLTETLLKCYSKVMGVHLIVTSSTMAAIGFQILTGAYSSPGAHLHLLGWSAACFINCHSGQTLKDHSQSTSCIIYSASWHELEPKLRKKLLMIMIRSDRPLLLTAGSFGALSYEMFIKIMRAAYMYLNMIRTSMN